MDLPVAKRTHIRAGEALVQPVKALRGREIEQLYGPRLLLQVCAFMRRHEMPAFWRAGRGLKRNCDADDLWRVLFARRCWGGVLANPLEFEASSLSVGTRCDFTWRNLYKCALQIETAQVQTHIRRLQRFVPGVWGYLAQYVGVEDEIHRVAARCGLRRNPILVNRLSDGFECVELMRQWCFSADSLEGPSEIMLISLEPEADQPKEELDNRLSQLRATGGTCKPLIDCLRCKADSGLEADQLMIALRKAIGATAVCDGTGEADQLAISHHCDVICCRGTRLAEYREDEIPEVRWVEWPTGEHLWEP